MLPFKVLLMLAFQMGAPVLTVENSCGAGFYSEAGASECTPCAAGSYSKAGASECTQCTAGLYSRAGASRCSWCTIGYYSAVGASECTKCPAGSTSPAASKKLADCVVITASNIKRCFLEKVDFQGSDFGGHNPLAMASVEACVKICSEIPDCKSITFKDDEELCWIKYMSFTPDMPDYKSNHKDVTGSLNMNCMSVSGSENWCAAGSYSSADSKECLQCTAGTYSKAGASECSQCAAGTYSNDGATACFQCVAGSYSKAGASECSQCAAGSYSEAGASECSQCPAETTSPAGSTQPSDCVAKTDGEMEISITPKKKRRKLMFKITAKRGGKKVIIPKESVKICRIFGQPDFPLTTDCEVAKMKTIYYYRQPERSPVANGDYVAIVEFGGILIQSEPITYKFE